MILCYNIDIMVLLKTPAELLFDICKKVKQRRKDLKLTQAEVADKSGVPLPTIRKYEQTGKISFESFVKIAFVLDIASDLLSIFRQKQTDYKSMDDLLKDK